MNIEVLEEAKEDLIAGHDFYEAQAPGLGARFLDSLFADIDSLTHYAGVHRVVSGSFRKMATRFPFAIYYRIEADVIRIRGVLDCRRNPEWIRRKIQ